MTSLHERAEQVAFTISLLSLQPQRIAAIESALRDVVADTWEAAANRAGYADPRIEEMFLKEAAALRRLAKEG